MRRSLAMGLGVAAVAVVAVAGIASASTSGDRSSTTPDAPAVAAPGDTPISQSEAEGIAVTLVPGSEVVESNLDTDRDRPVWNVHLRTANGQVEVKVDAETGAARIDDDGDDDADDRGDDNRRGRDDGSGHGGDRSGGGNSGRH